MNKTATHLLGIKVKDLTLTLTLTLTTLFAFANTENPNSSVTISKTELLHVINAFNESESSNDPDAKQEFPWRSVQDLIASLNTPEHGTWLIESINTWSDTEDQETTSIMCSKIGELATPTHIDLLLKLLSSPIPDSNKIWVIEAISRVKNVETHQKLKDIIQESQDWSDIEKALNTSPPEAAALALARSNNIENINFLLETLEKASTKNKEKELMQRVAIKRAIRDTLLNYPSQ